MFNFAFAKKKIIKNLKDNIKNKKGTTKKYILDNIRLFFWGKELLDNKEIWSYNIQNGSVIQMLAKPLQNKLGENKNLKLKVLSGITIDNDEEIDKKENENDEVDNLQETFTEQNKLLIKVNKWNYHLSFIFL